MVTEAGWRGACLVHRPEHVAGGAVHGDRRGGPARDAQRRVGVAGVVALVTPRMEGRVDAMAAVVVVAAGFGGGGEARAGKREDEAGHSRAEHEAAPEDTLEHTAIPD